MKQILAAVLFTALCGFSCGSAIHSIFGANTPREAYTEDLKDRGLSKTPEGRAWLAASDTALAHAVPVTLPYSQHGFFAPGAPRALALRFQAKRGEKLLFTLTKKTPLPFVLYADVFDRSNQQTGPVLSVDTAATQFSYVVDATGEYVLRVQPELYQSGDYTLSVAVGPSLGFPVSGTKGTPGSFWGDVRDGGGRRHEGIDIFAPKLTPVVAATDGAITGVREGGIGGKTVWLRTSEKPLFLYYAHLDKQLVEEGQLVKAGDTLGLVGNTGNAMYTPSHLHFGIYTFSGPIDPLPFVQRGIRSSPLVAAKNLHQSLKLVKAQKTDAGVVVKAHTIVQPLATSAKNYIAVLPGGQLFQVPLAAARLVKTPVADSASIVAKPSPMQSIL